MDPTFSIREYLRCLYFIMKFDFSLPLCILELGILIINLYCRIRYFNGFTLWISVNSSWYWSLSWAFLEKKHNFRCWDLVYLSIIGIKKESSNLLLKFYLLINCWVVSPSAYHIPLLFIKDLIFVVSYVWVHLALDPQHHFLLIVRAAIAWLLTFNWLTH